MLRSGNRRSRSSHQLSGIAFYEQQQKLRSSLQPQPQPQTHSFSTAAAAIAANKGTPDYGHKTTNLKKSSVEKTLKRKSHPQQSVSKTHHYHHHHHHQDNIISDTSSKPLAQVESKKLSPRKLETPINRDLVTPAAVRKPKHLSFQSFDDASYEPINLDSHISTPMVHPFTGDNTSVTEQSSELQLLPNPEISKENSPEQRMRTNKHDYYQFLSKSEELLAFESSANSQWKARQDESNRYPDTNYLSEKELNLANTGAEAASNEPVDNRISFLVDEENKLAQQSASNALNEVDPRYIRIKPSYPNDSTDFNHPIPSKNLSYTTLNSVRIPKSKKISNAPSRRRQSTSETAAKLGYKRSNNIQKSNSERDILEISRIAAYKSATKKNEPEYEEPKMVDVGAGLSMDWQRVRKIAEARVKPALEAIDKDAETQRNHALEKLEAQKLAKQEKEEKNMKKLESNQQKQLLKSLRKDKRKSDDKSKRRFFFFKNKNKPEQELEKVENEELSIAKNEPVEAVPDEIVNNNNEVVFEPPKDIYNVVESPTKPEIPKEEETVDETLHGIKTSSEPRQTLVKASSSNYGDDVDTAAGVKSVPLSPNMEETPNIFDNIYDSVPQNDKIDTPIDTKNDSIESAPIARNFGEVIPTTNVEPLDFSNQLVLADDSSKSPVEHELPITSDGKNINQTFAKIKQEDITEENLIAHEQKNSDKKYSVEEAGLHVNENLDPKTLIINEKTGGIFKETGTVTPPELVIGTDQQDEELSELAKNNNALMLHLDTITTKNDNEISFKEPNFSGSPRKSLHELQGDLLKTEDEIWNNEMKELKSRQYSLSPEEFNRESYSLMGRRKSLVEDIKAVNDHHTNPSEGGQSIGGILTSGTRTTEGTVDDEVTTHTGETELPSSDESKLPITETPDQTPIQQNIETREENTPTINRSENSNPQSPYLKNVIGMDSLYSKAGTSVRTLVSKEGIISGDSNPPSLVDQEKKRRGSIFKRFSRYIKNQENINKS